MRTDPVIQAIKHFDFVQGEFNVLELLYEWPFPSRVVKSMLLHYSVTNTIIGQNEFYDKNSIMYRIALHGRVFSDTLHSETWIVRNLLFRSIG